MIIGIIADSHNHIVRLQYALDQFQRHAVETILHCGDMTSPQVIELCSHVAPCYYVWGNNDDPLVLGNSLEGRTRVICLGYGGAVSLAGRKIAMTHGHIAQVRQELWSQEPDYFFTGHTHVACDERFIKTRHINPGALRRTYTRSVAVLNLLRDTLSFIKIPRHP